MKQPNAADLLVARRLRARREELGMSQSALAAALGVTFQQVQKYEKGQNRIAAGKLQRAAELLRVSATYFYATPVEGAEEAPRDIVLGSDENTLLKAFRQITDPKLRRHVLSVMKALGSVSGTEGAR